MVAKIFIIKGRVQGVMYRKSIWSNTEREIPSLKGYVRNLLNGDVEILGVGTVEQLARLKEIILRGSRLSHVEEIVEQETQLPNPLPTIFEIR